MIDDPKLDSLAYILARYENVRPRLAFPANGAAREWRSRARARLAELIAVPTIGRGALSPLFGEPKMRPGHRRIPVTFSTRPELEAFGYLLVPDKIEKPAPAVLCLPGHGRGVDDLVGIAEDGTDRDHNDGYQHDFAVQCVRRGYVTLALEMIGFGHRRDPAARKAGPSTSSCQTASGAALMLGETMVGWRVWDAMRALDLLAASDGEAVPLRALGVEVDPKRLAVMGISGGGTVGLYLAALDRRVKAAVLSCSFCTFKDSIYSISHCIDNFVPGVLRDFEVADIAGLIAPRFLIAENGTDDAIFPEAGVKAALRETQRIYAAQGAEKNIAHTFFNGGHLFHGEAAFARLREWL